MIGVVTKVVTKNAEAFLHDTRAELRAAQEKVTARMALTAEGRVKRRYYRGRVLHSRSGFLRSSVTSRREKKADGVSWVVGTDVKYAAAHEDGAVVTPRGRTRTVITGRLQSGRITTKQSKGRFLAIPLKAAKDADKGKAASTRAGVSRGSRGDQVILAWSKGRPFTTFVKDGILFAKRGTTRVFASGASPIGEKPTPFFALRRSVRIPKRPVWSRVSKVINRAFGNEFSKVFKQKIEKAKRHGA